MFTRLSAILIALALTFIAAPAAAEPIEPPWPTVERLYLLAADNGPLYWSPDPNDPEADRGSVVWLCGAGKPPLVVDGRPCFAPGAIAFPGAVFRDPPTWSASNPLRYHIEVTVDPPEVPVTVRLLFQSGSNRVQSEPATEVAPDVYEGTMAPSLVYNPSLISHFGVAVQTDGSRTVMELRTGGATYIDLPEPVAAKSVPQLLAESPSPDPNTYSTPTRRFVFNDRQWQTWSFQGDLSEVRTFDLDLPRDAETIVAWVEAYDTPFTHDVARGLPPDSGKLTDGAGPVLLRDGQAIANGQGSNRSDGLPSLAAVGVSAGALQLRVNRLNTSEGYPYTAHVLVTYGERTLSSMRWKTVSMDVVFLVPGVARCQYPLEPFPVTSEATTLSLDVDWDSVDTPLTNWVLNFELPGGTFYPCGGLGVRDRLRLTFPGERVWRFGVAPAPDSLMVSAYDTVFEYEVRYAYTPPPPPEAPSAG